jgi:hypothetical protein
MDQFRNHRQKCLGHSIFEFGAYLGFGFWDLGFEIARGGIHG